MSQDRGNPSGLKKNNISFKRAKVFLKNYRRCNSFTASCSVPQTDEFRDRDIKYEHYITKLDIPPEVQQKIAEIVVLIRDIRPRIGDQVDVINSLLDWCCVQCSVDAVLSYVDQSGYDLMQRIVAQGLDQVVGHVLDLGYNVHLLNRPCTSPMHLACRKGYVRILEQFLNHGADLKYKSSVCFPTQHCNGALMNNGATDNKSNMRWTNQNCCVSKKLMLINIALSSDNVEILKTLMLHKRGEYLDTRMALYNACQREATKCLAFMAPLLPEQANSRYGYRDDSLFFVAFSKSVSCGLTLMECDLQWKEDTVLKTNPIGESLLHLVLRYPAHENIYDLTKLAMEKCFPRSQINITDFYGNTPLLVLLKMVGRKVALPHSTARPTDEVAYESLVESHHRNWNEQIFDTVRYLVEEGAEVHITNRAGETALHALLKDHHHRPLLGMYSSFYKETLPEIIRVMEYLLTFDINVNSFSLQTATPLVWVVHMLSSLEVYSIDTTWPSFFYLFNLLLEHGADPNALDEKNIHIISIVFTTVNRWLNQCVSDLDLGRACRMLRQISSFVDILFKHGVHLGSDVLDLCMKQIMILCNVSIPVEATEQAATMLSLIGRIVSLFFIHTVDPHSLQMVVERHDFSEVPCKLHARFYLARAFIIHRHHQGMFDFFDVLESSLDQPHLNALVSSICNILSSNFEENSYRETSRCIQQINTKQRNARSLQILCKVAISKYMQWKLKQKVGCLQLPRALQKFLLYNNNVTF